MTRLICYAVQLAIVWLLWAVWARLTGRQPR